MCVTSETEKPLPDLESLQTVGEVVRACPTRLESLLNALDLERDGLAAVREAGLAGDVGAACKALLAYYRHGPSGAWLRHAAQEPGQRTRDVADNAVAGRFEQQGTVDCVPEDADGFLDWTHKGPLDDLQFAVFLNRHQYFPALVAMWSATGEEKYAATVDQLVKDWVLSYGEAPGGPNPREVWTTLNPGIRMATPWPRAFYGLQDSEAFSPAARLLLLWTVPEHAAFLQQHVRPGHNFATMQMNGLGTLGAAFPEFKDAAEWRRFAVDQIMREFTEQVYPDGVQKELTAAYHWVSLNNFEQLATTLAAAGYGLPDGYRQNVEAMYNYLACAMRPDGGIPMNNDSDNHNVQHRLLKAADRYEREDWRYIATCGEEGQRPDDPPSRAFPWAGQLISRNDWTSDANWSFFDVGPYGVSHQHNDALHLSVTVHGRDVLVDSGRFAYQGSIADKFRRPYALHSRAHNVVLLDGLGQQATDPEAQAPHPWLKITGPVDIAMGSFCNGYDPNPTDALQAWNGMAPEDGEGARNGRHDRAVVALRNHGWLVVDRISADGDHLISPLWHLHPDCTVHTEGEHTITRDPGKGNVRIVPVGPIKWRVDLVRGQETPTLQGWYSRTYGKVQPAPCAVYSSPMHTEAVFGWAILPGLNAPPPPRAECMETTNGVARMQVTWPDGPTTRLAVAFDEDNAIESAGDDTRKARVLVENDGQQPVVL